MRRLSSLLPLLLLAATAFCQSVVKVELTRDNSGKPGAAVRTLTPSDNPFHCVIQLKPLTSPMNFSGTLIAVDAGGVKDYRVVSTDIEAKAGGSQVDFKFSLPRSWPVGSYRIDVKANGKTVRTLNFEVK
jgi:hypothetical protein